MLPNTDIIAYRYPSGMKGGRGLLGSGLNFRQLKYFVAVAEEEHIGRAARRLNISQPPLTRQMQQLEEVLGVTLFRRMPKGIELTQAGRILAREAANLLSLVDVAAERTMKAEQGRLGRLDIGIFGSAILDLIPQTILRFRREYPDVNIVLHTMSKHDQILALRRRAIDVGFNRMLEPHEDIVTEEIIREPLMLAVNENHALATKKPLLFTDIAREPIVMFPSHARPGFIDRVTKICNEAGFSPVISQEVGDAVTGVALVASGFGVCLVPVSATVLSLPGVVFREFDSKPASAFVDLSCVYRANDPSPILARFLGTIRDYQAL